MSVIETHGWTYYGEVVSGQKHGRGAETGRGVYDGACYDGEFVAGNWHGKGVFWLGDGARCFDGLWDKGLAQSGTAVDPDGSFFRIPIQQPAPLFDDRTWRAALAGTKVPAGRPISAPAPRPRATSAVADGTRKL